LRAIFAPAAIGSRGIAPRRKRFAGGGNGAIYVGFGRLGHIGEFGIVVRIQGCDCPAPLDLDELADNEQPRL